MAVMLIAGAAIAAAGAIGGRVASRKSADAQKKRDKAELAETIRRTERTNRFTEGRASTQVAASGFAVGSSLDKYVQSMQAQHASDVDWMRTAGMDAVRGQYAESEARANAAFVQGIGSAIGMGGQAAASQKQYGWVL